MLICTIMATLTRILLLLGFLGKVSAGNVTLNWTVVGLTEINFSLETTIGSKIIIICAPFSYSNIVKVATKEQFLACDSNIGNAKGGEHRGSCIGRPHTTRLILNIEEASLDIPGDFGFVEGATAYLTSFSNGQSLASSIGNITAGGECLDGLKLALYVRDSSSTVPSIFTTEAYRPQLCTANADDLCVQECPLFYYGDITSMTCIPFESNYIVQSNATSYHVTAVTKDRSGNVSISFTILFEKNYLGREFFSSPAISPSMNSIQLSLVQTGNTEQLRFRFASGIRIVPADLTSNTTENLPLLTNVEHPNYGPALVLRDRIILYYTLVPPNVSPTYSFFIGIRIISNTVRVTRATFFSCTVDVFTAPSVEPLESYFDRPVTRPGDVLSYRCTALGSLPVRWTIRNPRQSQLTQEFRSASIAGNAIQLAEGVRVVLTGANESFVETVISLTVDRSESWDGTQLECSLASAQTDIITINITNEFDGEEGSQTGIGVGTAVSWTLAVTVTVVVGIAVSVSVTVIVMLFMHRRRNRSTGIDPILELVELESLDSFHSLEMIIN